jgi:quercetin dioxygenase-like cupin family protein
MLRYVLVSEGYRVFQWGDRPEAVYALHKHNEDQSHWVVSGTLEITIEGESYTLEAGDRDFLTANTWHSVRVIGEEAVVYLVGEKI